MRLFAFDPELARTIADWGTEGVKVSHVVDLGTEGRVSLLQYTPGATLGAHPTGWPQLFLVVSGTGWVAGGDGARREISAGTAALWDEGEVHSSGSDSGMTVVVTQSPDIDPANFHAREAG